VNKGRKLELALSSLYPGGMAQPTDDVPVKREDYARDIFVWMALCFFRHFFGQRIILEKGSAASDGGYELYRRLGTGGEEYMNKDVMNQFHQTFPMTKKAMNVLENHLMEIKEVIKGVVEAHGVLKSNCMLDTKRYPVDYLTCAEVKKEDLPWVHKSVSERAQTLKRSVRPGAAEEDSVLGAEDDSYQSDNHKRLRYE
jgi:hypothetical protein